jgi:hypothetical protein
MPLSGDRISRSSGLTLRRPSQRQCHMPKCNGTGLKLYRRAEEVRETALRLLAIYISVGASLFAIQFELQRTLDLMQMPRCIVFIIISLFLLSIIFLIISIIKSAFVGNNRDLDVSEKCLIYGSYLVILCIIIYILYLFFLLLSSISPMPIVLL